MSFRLIDSRENEHFSAVQNQSDRVIGIDTDDNPLGLPSIPDISTGQIREASDDLDASRHLMLLQRRRILVVIAEYSRQKELERHRQVTQKIVAIIKGMDNETQKLTKLASLSSNNTARNVAAVKPQEFEPLRNDMKAVNGSVNSLFGDQHAPRGEAKIPFKKTLLYNQYWLNQTDEFDSNPKATLEAIETLNQPDAPYSLQRFLDLKADVTEELKKLLWDSAWLLRARMEAVRKNLLKIAVFGTTSLGNRIKVVRPAEFDAVMSDLKFVADLIDTFLDTEFAPEGSARIPFEQLSQYNHYWYDQLNAFDSTPLETIKALKRLNQSGDPFCINRLFELEAKVSEELDRLRASS